MVRSRFSTIRTLSVGAAIVCTFAVSSLPRSANAETTDFGGYSERFKGGGDKIPPRCQIDVPTASTEPFFVKWNCTDDNADAQDIRTELWLYRNGAPTGELVANFLGFPASVKIDEGLLGVTEFRQGLPVSIKLLARDKAGITSISPAIVVRAQDNAVTTCSLNIETQATESTGATTGIPSLQVTASDAAVTVSQPSESQLGISSVGSVNADPCEISTVCFNDSLVSFSSSLSLSSDSKASGTVSIVPGSLIVNVSGTSSVNGTTLNQLSVSGTTTINGASSTVTLSCSK
ncbi:MAG: hypothetical protein U0136_20195 [Bdellovibrionota bacterium]